MNTFGLNRPLNLASASSSILFGENEFALRLPYLIISMIIALLLGRYALPKKINFFIPGIILFTLWVLPSWWGNLHWSNAVLFCRLNNVRFWECINTNNGLFWGGLFFVELAWGYCQRTDCRYWLFHQFLFGCWGLKSLQKRFSNCLFSVFWFFNYCTSGTWWKKFTWFIDYFLWEHFLRL